MLGGTVSPMIRLVARPRPGRTMSAPLLLALLLSVAAAGARQVEPYIPAGNSSGHSGGVPGGVPGGGAPAPAPAPGGAPAGPTGENAGEAVGAASAGATGPAPAPAPVPAPAPAPAAAPAAVPAPTPAPSTAPAPAPAPAPAAAPPAPASPDVTAVPQAPTTGSGPPPPTTTSPPSVAASEPVEAEQSVCVHVGEEHCPPAGELCRCKLITGTSTVICCDVNTQLQLKESLNCQGLVGVNITALHARNITLHSLDVSVLHLTKLHLPELESLAITDGHITELKGLLDAQNLACLNLSSNSLADVSENTSSHLYSLTNLDLSGNDLKHVLKLHADVTHFKLDISGNNNLNCDSIKELMKSMKNLQFSHDNNTYCLNPSSFHWFNSTEKVPLASVVMLTKLEEECPRGETEPCQCRAVRLDMVLGKPPTFSVEVDCSNRRLTKLPLTLPKNTVSLNVSNNNISNLEELSMNSAYKDIQQFYADDNQITSISALEGSTFIGNFHTLSVRNNNISSLPIYILSNAFDLNLRTVRLGLNHLKCDCSTAQTTKMWLNANYRDIPDYNEVLCENMRERVFELDQNKVCTVPSDWTEYVYYLVAAEVLLLILLVSKVSYDYWVFKTAGYLPWPASKMPKLPCDWVFES
ncbi:Protein halfway [Frankliniella fusca]|uniref:Protein halfway n=1 Tax=Frankliniella fusca TaxID=407009 RepID=A0AAE1LEB9_9NEOP|nr:Protein halfway [Frankliniella fusca]